MRIEVEDIGPSKANEWLLTRNTCNRKVKPTVVERYQREMEQGNWLMSDQAISFDTNGQLINGQHRCEAVVRSGRTIKSIVIYDMPEESASVIDSVCPKNLTDLVSIHDKRHADPMETATARVMMGLSKTTNSSVFKVSDFINSHNEAISFTRKQFPYKRRGITKAIVYAAIARATYHVDKDRLTEFCKVLFFGMAREERDLAAIKLRDFAKDMPASKRKDIDNMLYGKTERAIQLFCQGIVPRRGLIEPQHELFPLPEEKQKRTSRRKTQLQEEEL